MNLNVTVDTRTVQRMLERLTPEVGELAVKRTINKVADQAKTLMSREIRAEFNLSKAAVDAKLATRFARSEGRLRFTGQLLGLSTRGGRSWNVIRFLEQSVTLAEGRRRRKSGTLGRVFIKVKRTGGKKMLGDRVFIGNKGRTVFVRQEGAGRLPIKPVQTIDVPQMFNTKRINGKVVVFVRDKFAEVFVREARYALRQAGAA